MVTWTGKKIVAALFLLTFFIGGGAGFGFLLFISHAIKGSTPYRISKEFIKHNIQVENNIGKITEFGFLPRGQIQIKNNEGKAQIVSKVYGEKGSAKIRTDLYREESEWYLQGAQIKIKGRWISLIPLEIANVYYYEDSHEGPTKKSKKYQVGQTIYWTLVIENLFRKENEVSMQEDLNVIDQTGQIVLDEPRLAVISGPTEALAVSFQNSLDLPDVGIYTLRAKIIDNFSNREIIWEDKIEMVPATTLQISGFNFREQEDGLLVDSEHQFKKDSPIFLDFQVHGTRLYKNKINLIEDLYVLNEKGETLMSKPAILTMHENWNKNDVLILKNKLIIPEAGEFIVKIVVNDKNSRQKATREAWFNVQ